MKQEVEIWSFLEGCEPENFFCILCIISQPVLDKTVFSFENEDVVFGDGEDIDLVLKFSSFILGDLLS